MFKHHNHIFYLSLTLDNIGLEGFNALLMVVTVLIYLISVFYFDLCNQVRSYIAINNNKTKFEPQTEVNSSFFDFLINNNSKTMKYIK